jgi:hypothetical protein
MKAAPRCGPRIIRKQDIHDCASRGLRHAVYKSVQVAPGSGCADKHNHVIQVGAQFALTMGESATFKIFSAGRVCLGTA